jgi:hypothetical protein
LALTPSTWLVYRILNTYRINVTSIICIWQKTNNIFCSEHLFGHLDYQSTAGMRGAVVHRGLSVNDWNGFELGGVMMPFTDWLRCTEAIS